jgi:chromosome segregation ATPase
MTSQERLEEAIRRQKELATRFNELTEARQELRDEVMRLDGEIRLLKKLVEGEKSNATAPTA